MKKILIWFGVTGLALYIYERQKQSLSELSQSLTINPDNVSLNTSNILSPKMILTFELNNPTPTSFSITKIYATVMNNGQLLATINNNTTVTVSPISISKLPIQLNIDTASVLQDIFNGDLSNSVLISGYAQSGLVQVPFTKTLTIPSL